MERAYGAETLEKRNLEKPALWASSRFRSILRVLAFFLALMALILFPGEITQNVRSSILYCLTVLVPSLFPFMVLTSFTVNSGAGESLGKCLGFLSRHVFRLPDICAAPILMSFLGGYPAGAKGASLLLEQGKIDREQAGRMMLFCVNPGVAFVVTFLGGEALHSFQAGWLLFLAVTFSGLLLGVLSGLGKPVPKKAGGCPAAPLGNALTRSVSDASKSVVIMCACIVLFSGFTAVLHGSGLFSLLCRGLSAALPLEESQAGVLLSFLWEVTGGVGAGESACAGAVLYAFGLAFGGLCVHLQVFALFRDFPLKKWKFFLFRLLHGGISFLAAAALTRLLPYTPVEAFFAGEIRAVSPLSGTLAGGLSLLLMCMAFLVITTDREK